MEAAGCDNNKILSSAIVNERRSQRAKEMLSKWKKKSEGEISVGAIMSIFDFTRHS